MARQIRGDDTRRYRQTSRRDLRCRRCKGVCRYARLPTRLGNFPGLDGSLERHALAERLDANVTEWPRNDAIESHTLQIDSDDHSLDVHERGYQVLCIRSINKAAKHQEASRLWYGRQLLSWLRGPIVNSAIGKHETLE